MQIHSVNRARLSRATIDPATCRVSEEYEMGAALVESTGDSPPTVIQSVCHFAVKPLRVPAEVALCY